MASEADESMTLPLRGAPGLDQMAVYVSRRDVVRDASGLPLVARQLYALLDLRELVEEQLREPARLRKIQAARALLGTLNGELRLRFGSRERYEGVTDQQTRAVKKRDLLLASLDELERSDAHERLESVEAWATALVQTGETLTAYRVYRVEEGERHKVYIEQGTDHPKAMVVTQTFDDALAQHAVRRWCGREDEVAGEEA